MRLRGFLLLQLGVYVYVCIDLYVDTFIYVHIYMRIHLHVYTLAHALRQLNRVAATREIQLLRKLNHKNIVKLKVRAQSHTHTHTRTHMYTCRHTYTPQQRPPNHRQ